MIFGFFILGLLLFVLIYLSLDKITEIVNKFATHINEVMEENKKKALKKNEPIEMEILPKNIIEYGDIDSAVSDLKRIQKKMRSTTKVPSDRLTGKNIKYKVSFNEKENVYQIINDSVDSDLYDEIRMYNEDDIDIY